MPQLNQAGLDLIEEFEGLSLTAYPDPGTGGEPWTIGYGHTGGVTPGETITQEQAEEFLKSDVAGAETSVENLVEVDLTPNQFAALVSFTFNLGGGALAGSTLLALVNSKEFDAAAQQFGRWVYADGQELEGLVRRRAAEAKLFLTP
jgi:lysozyme